MKRFVFVLTILFSTVLAFGQTKAIPVNEATQKITFQKVIQVSGTADELYQRGLDKWFNEYYKNPSGVLVSKDAEQGSIRGKHVIYLDCNEPNNKNCPVVNYKFTFEARDGRVRCTMTDFTLKTQSLFPIENWLNKEDKRYTPEWDNYLDQIATFAEEWFASIEEKIQPEKVFIEEEW